MGIDLDMFPWFPFWRETGKLLHMACPAFTTTGEDSYDYSVVSNIVNVWYKNANTAAIIFSDQIEIIPTIEITPTVVRLQPQINERIGYLSFMRSQVLRWEDPTTTPENLAKLIIKIKNENLETCVITENGWLSHWKLKG